MQIHYTTLDNEKLYIEQVCENGFGASFDRHEAIDLKPHEVETLVQWLQEGKPEDFDQPGEQVRTIQVVSPEMVLEIHVNK